MLFCCFLSKFQGFGVCFLIGKYKPIEIKRKTKLKDEQKENNIRTSKESIVSLLTERQDRKHSNFKKQDAQSELKNMARTHFTLTTTTIAGKTASFCSQVETKTTSTTQHKKTRKTKTNRAKEEDKKQTKKQGRFRVKWGGTTSPDRADPKPSRTKNKNKQKQKQKLTNQIKTGIGSGEVALRATSLDPKPSKRKMKENKKRKRAPASP